MTKQENIILCDCRADEVSSLSKALLNNGKTFSIKSHIANWKRTGAVSELKRYGKYFLVALKCFFKRKKYGTIIGWQQFYALIFAFYCSLFGVKKCNKILVLNFIYKEKKGKFAKLYFWFMKKCLSTGYVDYLHVLSKNYAEIVSETFNFPIDNIIVFPFGVNDPYDSFSKLERPKIAPEDYILSIGRSNRDFDFLIKAWQGIEYPLVVISDTYNGNNLGNNFVQIINNVAGSESYPWIANCDGMIIPIDDGTICSGDTVLLTALAMKKKVLITAPSTLAEMYIEDKQNGLLTHKDIDEFNGIVSDMVFTDKYDYLCDNARQSYLTNFSRMSMGENIAKLLD